MMKDFYVGVKGVVRVGDKCLVLRRVDGERVYWDIPGGRIDDNETLEMALRRELGEEAGLHENYLIKNLLHAYRLGRDLVDGRGLVLVFYRVDADDFTVAISDEHTEYRWVTREEAMSLESDMDSGYYTALSRAFGSAE
jgi:8-oxo-dGTP pyrophosphatase MutT (NUDIX family)